MASRAKAGELLRRPGTRALGWSAVAFIVVTGLWWVHLFNQFGIDDWIERVFFAYASPSVGIGQYRDVVLIGIDERSTPTLGAYGENVSGNAAWRAHHAALVDRLTAAGAVALAFDAYFPAVGSAHKEATERFAAAITAARASGQLQVVIGYTRRYATDPLLAGLATDAGTGLVDVARTTGNLFGKAYVGRILMAEMTVTPTGAGDQQRLLYPLPMPLAIYLASLRAEKGAERVTFDPFSRELRIEWPKEAKVIQVEVESCAIDEVGCAPDGEPDFAGAQRVYRAVLPFWIRGSTSFRKDSYSNLAGDVDLAPDFAGRIVIVGAETADEVLPLGPGSPDDTAYGYQVIARVVADLLADRYLRRPGSGLQISVFVLLVAIGFLARLRLPFREIAVELPLLGKRRLPLGFFVVTAVAVFIALWVFRREYLVFDLTYGILALALGYFAVPKLSGLITDHPEAKQ
jgi:CHASE2 domain-containing sensor protein